MKKVIYYLLLTVFIAMMLPYYIVALNESEVSHYFVTKGAYGYEEIVEDVMFDHKRKRIVLICKDQEQCLCESKTMVKYEKIKEK